MNGPDKAGEPSMEEILASIRQIIADEPESERPVSDGSRSAFVPDPPAGLNGSATVKKEARPGAPLIDRLNGVLKGQQTPTSPLGSKRPLPFDQDLADMLDDDGAAQDTATRAPKPDLRGAPEFGLAAKPFLPTEVTAKPGASQLPPQVAPSEPLVPPPFGTANSSPSGASRINGNGMDSAAPAPPRSFGFPPLRKQGFYPPQPSTPSPPPRPAEALPQDGPDVASAPSRATSPATSEDTASKQSSAFGSAPPAGIEAHTPSPFGFGAPSPSSTIRPTPSFQARIPQGVPASDAPLVVQPASMPPAASLSGEAKGASTLLPADDTVAAVVPEREPARTTEPQVTLEPRIAAAADAAAAQALDALALGLAASAASQGSQGAGANAPIALTPQLASTGAPARTLEDAVADMLRPMLQQWVADNMPRIIERALRVEVANTVKPGSGSQGS